MDLKKLSLILNSDIDDSMKESAIIMVLSKDKNVIPNMLDILKAERETNEIIITDMNLELSRAHVYLDEIEYRDVKKEAKTSFSKKFVLDNIVAFYKSHKNRVSHLFYHNEDIAKPAK